LTTTLFDASAKTAVPAIGAEFNLKEYWQLEALEMTVSL